MKNRLIRFLSDPFYPSCDSRKAVRKMLLDGFLICSIVGFIAAIILAGPLALMNSALMLGDIIRATSPDLTEAKNAEKMVHLIQMLKEWNYIFSAIFLILIFLARRRTSEWSWISIGTYILCAFGCGVLLFFNHQYHEILSLIKAKHATGLSEDIYSSIHSMMFSKLAWDIWFGGGGLAICTGLIASNLHDKRGS